VRRCYYLPTDIAISGDVSGADRARVAATMSAAIAQVVSAVAPPGERLHPAAGIRPQPRERVTSADRDVYFLPSYGGDDRVGFPVTSPPAPATAPPSNPVPLTTADVPMPPDLPDIALTEGDSPAFGEYLRNLLDRGADLSTPTPLDQSNHSVDVWREVIQRRILRVDRGMDFWGIDIVRGYAQVLALGYQDRVAAPRPVDIGPRMRELAISFDETMQGSFSRNRFFGVPLAELDKKTMKLLTAERAKLEAAARRRHLTGKDLDHAVLDGLLAYRANLQGKVERHVVNTAWGWMREQREHLDFETLKSRGVRSLSSLHPSVPSSVVEADVVHAELVRRKLELSQKELDKVLAEATKEMRKRKNDPTLELSADDAAAAIARAEKRRLGGDTDAAVTAAAALAEQDEMVDVYELDDNAALVWGNAWQKKDPNDPEFRVYRQTAEFVRALKQTFGKHLSASSYTNHGLGPFKDRGRSIDLHLDETEPSGFFVPAEAIRLALAIDTTAQQFGVEWRVLYNDASVARAVNQRLGVTRIVEIANVFREHKQIRNINWHGPLVTHFHLDLAF
jgi:hypothetical protein